MLYPGEERLHRAVTYANHVGEFAGALVHKRPRAALKAAKEIVKAAKSDFWAEPSELEPPVRVVRPRPNSAYRVTFPRGGDSGGSSVSYKSWKGTLGPLCPLTGGAAPPSTPCYFNTP